MDARPTDSSHTTSPEPIAVIGLACRFPQAANVRAYWQLLRDGVDAITTAPLHRWNAQDIPASAPRWGGFLEDIDRFDAGFFGISPREARYMDPQHRLFLEVAWEALEDAGQPLEYIQGSRVGVFAGLMFSEYEQLVSSQLDSAGIYAHTGNLRSSASGRVSHAFGLQGPSLTVDTAASSSLVAVHLACQSLRGGECTLALAGGANLILRPQQTLYFAQANMMAGDGRCKFGDASADGFVRSEGAGIVVLKPLPLARRDGDRIYAVIRGSAVNNDGGDNTFMTPSRRGQEAVLREAYRNAGVSPASIHYVEAHGTGTSVGDPIEVQALIDVLGEGRSPDRPCAIGSVKTNIGHTEAAAGIAGLIKAALALKHNFIPSSLHFRVPNPDIPWQTGVVAVQRAGGPWPGDAPHHAGVSAFGITGTNAHVVLEEAPPEATAEPAQPDHRAHLLAFSARSAEALSALADAYRSYLSDGGASIALHDVCYNAGARRTHHDHRLALVGHSPREMLDQIDAVAKGETRFGIAAGRSSVALPPKVAFVFPGQGSQWQGMGRELMASEPIFRATLEACERAMRRYVDRSVLEEVNADESRSRLGEVDVIQPLIFAIQVALAALWRSWGIQPAAVVGHSMGEIAAAHVAGSLSLEDAARVICRRSQIVKTIRGQGGMVVVGLSMEACRETVSGYEDRVSVAISYSPAATVLSGDPAALREILDHLEAQNIFCRWIKVDYASHSPQVEPLLAQLRAALEGVQSQAAHTPIYSTVNGSPVDGSTFDANYWVRNLRAPVLFSQAIEHLLANDCTIFLEVSPHPILLSAIQQTLQHAGRAGSALPSTRREEAERETMLATLGALYAQGCAVNWDRLFAAPRRFAPLPSYPWQRERFWIDAPGSPQPDPIEPEAPRSRHLAGEARLNLPLTHEDIQAIGPASRQLFLEARLGEEVAALLYLPMNGLDAQQRLSSLGMDSLMGVVLKNWIEDNLGLKMPSPGEMVDATLSQLARHILEQIRNE